MTLKPNALQWTLDWAHHCLMCSKLDKNDPAYYNWTKNDGRNYALVQEEIREFYKLIYATKKKNKKSGHHR